MDATDTPRRDSLGTVAQLPASRQPSNSSASTTDARNRLIGELALRFPGSVAADRDSERARLRLLIADTSHLSVANLGMAIRAGVKTWKFMPTAAEIITEAKFFVEMDKVATYEAPALPAPTQARLSDNTDADALLRDTFAKLAAGHNKLTGGTMPGAPVTRAPTGRLRSPAADDLATIKQTLSPPRSGVSPALKAMLGIETGEAA